METVDEIYEKLRNLRWFKSLSLDRRGEICVIVFNYMRGKNESQKI